MKHIYALEEKDLQELIPYMGYCIASNFISVQGEKVAFMYREEPEDEDDSGWRFLSGLETDEYLENVQHFMMFDVNYIANIDKAIIPYLKHKKGTELEREENSDTFKPY